MRTVQYIDPPLTAMRELVRVTKPGGRIVIVEGGLAAVDLPDGELTRYVFGPRGRSFGAQLPGLLRDAGLQRIVIKAPVVAGLGSPDPRIIEYARAMTANAIAGGTATETEAQAWLAGIEARAASGTWSSADAMFVVAGTKPAEH